MHQAFVDAFEPDPRSESARQHAKPRASQVQRAVHSPHAPEPKRRSPLPSVREIDAALEAKYGAPRWREV
jgi:hypothetical protein